MLWRHFSSDNGKAVTPHLLIQVALVSDKDEQVAIPGEHCVEVVVSEENRKLIGRKTSSQTGQPIVRQLRAALQKLLQV